MTFAHRQAWASARGSMPPPDVMVCHKCDTPACVNADHLFLGSAADNTRDCVSKLRQAYGERSARAVLTAATVLEIKRALAAGERVTDVARRYALRANHVSMIGTGFLWKQVVL